DVSKDDYLFRMQINDILNKPTVPSPDQTLNPNGRITVPDMTGDLGPAPDNITSWELKKHLPRGKTVLQVVVSCMNAAGLEFDHRNMGCFIFWPESDTPWITFPDALSADINSPDDLFTVFPGTSVTSKAYDDDSVKSVEYSIYNVNLVPGVDYGTPDDTPLSTDIQTNSINTKSFSWNFSPPAAITTYYIKAVVTDINDKKSPDYTGYFRTRDISWPDIRAPYDPISTVPLYRALAGASAADWQFTIRGIASDSSSIKGISMVWINPHSANYSAMSQLAYFRDQDYQGWINAEASPDNPYSEDEYDTSYPNKVWKFDGSGSGSGPVFYPNPVYAGTGGINPTTRRMEYEYKVTLSLKDDMNIWPGADGYDYLKSQIFVFKVTGGTQADDGTDKTSIIVWSPEGASSAPAVSIDHITITRAGGAINTYDMASTDQIDYFRAGDKIQVYGNWREDSAAYQSIDTVLRPYFDVTISNALIPKEDVGTSYFKIDEDVPRIADLSGALITPGSGTGTWEVYAEVGSADNLTSNALRVSHLRDSLMLNAKITNIGGHSSEYTKTWFVKTDIVDFMRLGSDTPDGTYNSGNVITFYLEFNKKVQLKGSTNPRLLLNTGGIAVYQPSATPDERQYFTYTIGPTDSSPVDASNTIQSLNIVDVASGTPAFDNSAYPFTWINPDPENKEEIRMVIDESALSYSGPDFIVKAIPSGDSSAALNSIKYFAVDTTPPVLNSFVLSGKGGWYGAGNAIYITATFSEPINIPVAPRLKLSIANSALSVTAAQGQWTDPAQLSGNTLLFKYPIKNMDTTDGADVVITDFDGSVQDVAKNDYTFAGLFTSAYTAAFRTPLDTNGTAAKVKAIPIAAPTLEVHTGDPSGDATLAKTVSGGATIQGTSGGVGVTPWTPGDYPDSESFNAGYTPIVQLNNYYSNELWLLIKPVSYEAGFDRLEYSINYGRSWAYVDPNMTGNWVKIQRSTQGNYDITTRQSDAAGNTSQWSQPVTLYWDKGDLLTRITSTKQGGTYTNNALVQDEIPIVLTFRREVNFTTAPTLTLTADDGTKSVAPYQYVTVTGAPGKTTPDPTNVNVNTYTINYPVGPTDTSRGGLLNVTAISGFTAIDNASADVT
ncbi:MAG: hypothetical protein FWF29_09570, partial [Treponema sp.]|nr:hypothetical protein [Treponema sp.]